jgi:hypothetical protein
MMTAGAGPELEGITVTTGEYPDSLVPFSAVTANETGVPSVSPKTVYPQLELLPP